MGKRIKKILRKLRISRTTVLGLLFVALSLVLIYRVYVLQIEHGEEYRSNFSLMTTRTRTLRAARGCIYDRNGNVLASNRLSYSLTIEDSGTYESSREKALSLNGEAYRIASILKKHGDSLSNDFHIIVDENGEYAFDVTGRTLSRFKADVYGHALIDDLTEQEANSTAAEMVDYLSANNTTGGFSLYRVTRPYTAEELSSHGLPETLTKEEVLDILFVRYQLFTTSYRKYVPVTIATELSEESVAEIYEHGSSLTGVEVVEDTVRLYDQPEAFASIIGYIGKVSAEDLSELRDQDPSYNTSSVVGKSGIEKLFELNLQGTDGEETVYVDNLGRVLQKDEEKTIEPHAGENIYLTIDKNLQVAAYKMLEQRIAGVLESMVIDANEFDKSKVTDTSDIRIPITDVYNSLISNHVLDTAHFEAADATEQESELLAIYNQKENEVLSELREQLTGGKEIPYKKLSREMKEYQSYIVNSFLKVQTKILPSSAVDTEDPVYNAWVKEESISLREYLLYAASQNWIDISAFQADGAYLDSEEIFNQLVDYILEHLPDSLEFRNTLYRYLILDGRISGKMLVQVLYDQDIFHTDDEYYEEFRDGKIKAYDLVIKQIHDLVLTPAMLALDPCSGSAVITNPKNGEVLACVTYPGYDNNRLANKMDMAYYNLLANDASRPFYNKATQQTTAPGSTFKPVTATAGMEEGVITEKTKFDCTGIFELVDTPLACWYKAG
ncbi:MAG: penicillin-binding transpeptidase domain-containing protein, partial [Lachnospiraceae bacterium]